MGDSAAPPIAVSLFLSAIFLLACRWIKRNPSSFLRYALFPFGGLKVERWPRIMLMMVRGGAILGFFSFSLAFMSLLAPESFAHPTPGVLYTKFAVAILVSFFALRGSAEPGESGEAAEPRPLAYPQQAAPKSVPTPSKSTPVPPKSTPLITKPAPITTRGLTPTPIAPVPLPENASAKAPTRATAAASSSAQSRLSDVEAAPIPNRSNSLIDPPEGLVKQRQSFMVSSFVFGVVFVGSCYLLGITWLVVAFSIFFGLALVILFFGLNAKVGACPFCGGLIERYNRLRAEPVRCEQCNEISKFEEERFSPYEPTAVAEKPIFRSPLFENGFWPNGCVLCGAAPTHFDEAKAVRYQARRLATPTASAIFMPHPAARVTGVPYCAQHREALQVIPPKEMFAWTPWNYVPGFAERMAERRKAFLMWRSLPMMRRYLEANRRAKSGVSAGYREPNLLQKTVSAAFTKPEPQAQGAASPRASTTKPGS
jgi:uncharacterized membrane protein